MPADDDGGGKGSLDDEEARVDDELERIVANNPGVRIMRPGDELPPQPPGPQEDPAEVREQRSGLEEMRRGMDAAARLDKAEECKSQANEHFKNGKWKVSMVGYVAGIWFLKAGSPPCPRIVVSETGVDEVVSVLGDGSGNAPDAVNHSDGAIALRITCHLNLAQAALKISEWRIARAACKYVLEGAGDERNTKALFRLAKAEQGAGDLGAAASTVGRLLKHDPTNVEARKLSDDLKRQKTKEKKAFSGMFDRAHKEGEGLYTAEEEARDKAEQAARRTNPAPHSKEEADIREKGARTIRGSDIMNMTPEEQQRFVDEINASLDDEAGDPGVDPGVRESGTARPVPAD
jgi:hypothetical protein